MLTAFRDCKSLLLLAHQRMLMLKGSLTLSESLELVALCHVLVSSSHHCLAFDTTDTPIQWDREPTDNGGMG